MNSSQKRFRLVLSSLTGILLGSLYVLIAPNAALSQQAETEAREMGFTSLAQKEALYKLRRNVDYTPDQFDTIQKVIQSAKGLARVTAIERLRGINSLPQKRHALEILKPVLSDKILASATEDVLYCYYEKADSKSLVEALTHDPNPAIASLARTAIADVEQDAQKQAARAQRRQRQLNKNNSLPKP